jgi:hypothetical protein
MKRIIEQEITSFYGQFFKRVYDDKVFERCRFVSCKISVTSTPRRRSRLRNVKFTNCEFIGCALGPAIVKDVVITNMKTSALFIVSGAVFKHVVFQGNIDKVMFRREVHPGVLPEAKQRAFDEANSVYYQTVD